MFNDKRKFTKFLRIATPIVFGFNILILCLKFVYFLTGEGEYIIKMYNITAMVSGPGMLNAIYPLSGFVFVGNAAVSILMAIALFRLKCDNFLKIVSLVCASLSIALLASMYTIGLALDPKYISYWVIPLWCVLAIYYCFFSIFYFTRMFKYRKETEKEEKE